MEAFKSDGYPNQDDNNADVLLVTVTEVETRTVLDIAKEKVGEPKAIFEADQVYYKLGRIGSAQTYLVRSEMGSGGPDGSMMTVSEAIETLSPSAVIMVGIAFGVNREKQRIGDILVSKHIWGYELQRVGTGPDGSLAIMPRGTRIPAASSLLSRFRHAALQWDQSGVYFGLLFSGEKVIDNVSFRDQLLEIEPEAIGGEMEGFGLYSAASRKSVDWILVKAICDWADGEKYHNKDRNQQLAARNAVEFTFSVIAGGGFSYEETDSMSFGTKDVHVPTEVFSHPEPDKWIVLIQDTLVPADMKSILKALEPDKPLGDPVFIRPDTSSWQKAVEDQHAFVEDLLTKSRLSQCTRFAVFSVAPIPLIVHLGFMLADTQARCYKLHIDTKSWVWPKIASVDIDQDIHIHGLPEKTIVEECEVLIRVSLSARIRREETGEVAPDLPVQIDMFVNEPGRMWLRSPKQLEAIANAFHRVLEVIQSKIPKCKKIHLFYAGPAPGAFVIGQLINPRMIPPIQLYQYNRNNRPCYERAVILPLYPSH